MAKKYLTIKQVLTRYPNISQQLLQAQMTTGEIRVKVRRKDVKRLAKAVAAIDQDITKHEQPQD